jgi:hypothetical protein
MIREASGTALHGVIVSPECLSKREVLFKMTDRTMVRVEAATPWEDAVRMKMSASREHLLVGVGIGAVQCLF